MTHELTEQQTSTLRFKREVEDRFGVLPNFFCSAGAAPGLVEELWKFAKSAYLDSPDPTVVFGARNAGVFATLKISPGPPFQERSTLRELLDRELIQVGISAGRVDSHGA